MLKSVEFRVPRVVWVFATVSLLNEISAQMVAPLIPILLVAVLSAGPVALGAVEGFADAVAAFLKLWSGRHADVRPLRRKSMVLAGYGLALCARPLMAFAGSWVAVAILRSADRLGKGLRGAPRDAILADATPPQMQGVAYGLNRGMDYAGAVVGTLIAAATLAWSGMSIPQVIMLSALPGLAMLVLLALLPASASADTAADSQASTPVPPLFAWSHLSPTLRRYLQVLALFCFAKASEAFIVLRGYELGMSTVTLLLLWAWLAVMQTIAALVGGPVTDRTPKLALTVFNWLSLAFGYLMLAMASTVNALLLAVTFYGLLSGISEGVERALVSELANKGEKGTGFGWYYMVTGLAAVPAGLLFGFVWKTVGPGAAFGLAAFIALASAAWLKIALPATAADVTS